MKDRMHVYEEKGGRNTGRTFRLTLRLMLALSQAKEPTTVIIRSNTIAHAAFALNSIAQYMDSFGIKVNKQNAEKVVVVMGLLEHIIKLDTIYRPIRGTKGALIFCDEWRE